MSSRTINRKDFLIVTVTTVATSALTAACGDDPVDGPTGGSGGTPTTTGGAGGIATTGGTSAGGAGTAGGTTDDGAEDPSGCGCSVPRSDHSRSFALLLAAAALGVRRRNRRTHDTTTR